jgi:hypothetical protein
MDEGNFITKYWLKKFKWYDIRFMLGLPLFMVYMWILTLCIFGVIFIQFILWVLSVITNIRLFDITVKDIHNSGEVRNMVKINQNAIMYCKKWIDEEKEEISKSFDRIRKYEELIKHYSKSKDVKE